MPIENPQALLDSLRSHPHETEWFEFKGSYYDKKEIGEYISALANSAMLHDKPWAYLVYGVENKTHDVIGTQVRLKNEKGAGQEELENWLLKMLDPHIKFEFISFEYGLNHVEMIRIEPGYSRPVLFQNISYIRLGSYKKKLIDHPAIQASLWALCSVYSFEEGIAAAHLKENDLFSQFFCEELALILYKRDDLSRNQIIEKFIVEGLLIDNLEGSFDATNLLALTSAKNINLYRTVSGKTPRVIKYKGASKLKNESDQAGVRGYIIAFEALLKYIMLRSFKEEVMMHGIMQKTYLVPEVSVREILANSMIHQNLLDSTLRPTIEIFEDRMVITNTGAPLIPTERFIDFPSKTRNQKLSELMYRAGLCEKRGSGIDRALKEIESLALPPPLFEAAENTTIVTLYGERSFADMTKEERIRACYQHACRLGEANQTLSNSSLRGRLGLSDRQASQVSIVIREAIDAKKIRPVDEGQANRNARYVPYRERPDFI